MFINQPNCNALVLEGDSGNGNWLQDTLKVCAKCAWGTNILMDKTLNNISVIEYVVVSNWFKVFGLLGYFAE